MAHGRPKEFVCGVCGDKFLRKDSLKRHKLIHDLSKLAVCHVCGNGYHRADELKQHMTTHSDTVYKCGHASCGKTFASKANLKRHGKSHEDDERHICIRCGQVFSRKDSLSRHQSRRCSVPQKQPTSKKRESQSTTRLTAKYQLKCIHCDEKFTYKSNLTRHLNSRHSTRELYKCSTCNKAYTRKDSLVKHKCSGQNQQVTLTPPSDKQRAKKSRTLKKFRAVIGNETPKSKAYYAEHLISSPRTQKILQTKKIIQSKQQKQDQAVHTAVFEDIQTVMQATKSRKNTNTLRLRQNLLACGDW